MSWKALLGIAAAAGAAAVVAGAAGDAHEESKKRKRKNREKRLAEIEEDELLVDRLLTLDDFKDQDIESYIEYYFESEKMAKRAAAKLNELADARFQKEVLDSEAACELTTLSVSLNRYGDEDEAVIHCIGKLDDRTSMNLICVPYQHGKRDDEEGHFLGIYDPYEDEDTLVGVFEDKEFDETLTWPVAPGDRLVLKSRFRSMICRSSFEYEEDDQLGLFVVYCENYSDRTDCSGPYKQHLFGYKQTRFDVPFAGAQSAEVETSDKKDVLGAFFDQLKARLDEVIEEEDVTAMAEKTINDYIQALENEGREVSADLMEELARVGQMLLESRARKKSGWSQ